MTVTNFLKRACVLFTCDGAQACEESQFPDEIGGSRQAGAAAILGKEWTIPATLRVMSTIDAESDEMPESVQ